MVNAGAIAHITARVCRTHHWKIDKNAPHPVHVNEPLTDEMIDAHLGGLGRRGVCPMAPGESTTRLALLDFDSHKGETSFEGMIETATRVRTALQEEGLEPVPFVSSGGRGLHLFMLWNEPQDAFNVREALVRALGKCGLSNGTKGVGMGQVEIFPKQNRVPEGGCGSMFALPLAMKSVPLDPELWEELDHDAAVWRRSAPVIICEAPTLERVTAVSSGDLERVRSALVAIPDEVLEEWDYDAFIKCAMGVHAAAGGSEEGLGILMEFASRSSKYDETDTERFYRGFKLERDALITEHSIFRIAHAHGWVDPDTGPEAFEVLPPLIEEEAREQVLIQARNKEKARRETQKAIERAKFGGGRDALEAARRDYQKAANERIGNGEHTVPPAEVITLEVALGRFVFESEGSRVGDIFNPHYDLALADWINTYAASKETVSQANQILDDGTHKKKLDEEVPVSKLWRFSSERKTVVCRTFKAGAGIMVTDPEGRSALNTWRPFDRTSVVVRDLDAAGIRLFLDHVKFLFPNVADAGRFLDWLAHIEQDPGTLPHTAWLHIAKHFGLGRNWLASVLSRVWAGAVAANVDLPAILRSGFNGRLSRKVLAIVDEIREGGRDSQWEHSEKMKSLITEEIRLINPKYGRQSVECNACRLLMLSNHLSAIPLEKGDRRIEVVISESAPRDGDYYTGLYNALNDPMFIAAVAAYLGQRDIRSFKPGAWAVNSESKQTVTQASQTPWAYQCDLLVKHWPSDLITSQVLGEILTGGSQMGLSAAHRRTLEQCGVEPLGKPVKVDGRGTRIQILRNKARWCTAEAVEVRAELERGGALVRVDFGKSAIEFLMNLAAE